MRHYQGFISDSARWEGFELRPDDVIVATPAKCGTTWMQAIVGMLLHDRVELGVPMGLLSPWLDMNTRDLGEVTALLDAQTHRRFIKSHTPLDGLPWNETVTYLVVLRHPLDAALSHMDHMENMALDRVGELRRSAAGDDGFELLAAADEIPPERDDRLRWWIDDEAPPQGAGMRNLRDLALQARTYWDKRDEPNVHLFHYSKLEADLEGQMRRVAAALEVDVEPSRWSGFVEAASFGSMKERSMDFAPEAHLDFWESTESFFRSGGTRDWEALLTPDDIAHFGERLRGLAGADCARWIEEGVAD